ncbi:Dps family protein [Chachezhania antarctica]|uniref:Dps family protein n=1 Tax=Chachezhania antarctica TaxID=2340860 RepID=UPI000EB0D0D2|nr:DNA starvation/stationary phase protection protein [Chachezhania antarctica]|tara:strand:+ start:200 stop:697 length:498 start_codon:yes stop_codon:yes gene_type:complete
MTDALNVVPHDIDTHSGVKNSETIANALSDVLADTYALTLKTHICHWNVEGPLFYAVHNLTEEQYEDMFQAADELAERIRALGLLTPMKMSAILGETVVEELGDRPSAGDMCNALAADHTRLAHRLRAVIEISEGNNDAVTADMATARAAFHEKSAWMLHALSAS